MTQTTCRILVFIQLSLLVFASVTPCVAQQTPVWEFFAGYSFQRSDVRQYFKSTPIIYSLRGRYVNLDGLDLSVTENVNRWFGGTLDFRGHYKTPQLLGTTTREKMYSILYGPRFSYRTHWVTPFTHILFGIARVEARVTPVGPHASDLSFATAAGGGLDISLGGKAAVRAFEVDYFRTDTLGTRPDSFRASTGVVFYLGQRK